VIGLGTRATYKEHVLVRSIGASTFLLLTLVSASAPQTTNRTDVVSTAQYDLDVRLLPAEHRMEASGIIKFPSAQASRDAIELQISDAIDTFNVEVIQPSASAGAAKLNKKDSRGSNVAWTVHPAHPFPASEAVVLRVSYAGGANTPSGFFYVGPEVSFSYANWYPFMQGTRGTGKLRFSVPKGFTVAATGAQRTPAAEPSGDTFLFETSVPSDFAFAAGKFTVYRQKGTVPVSAYLLRPRKNVHSYIVGTLRVLKVLEEQFGDYPYGEFKLIEVPSEIAARSGFGAFALDGGIILRSQFFDQPFNLAAYAHEVAHEWWGHIIQHTGTRGDYMLDEGMSQFGSLLAVEAIEGAQAAERYRRKGYRGFNADLFSGLGYLKLAGAGLDHPLANLPDSALSYWIAYSKAGFVWDLLSRTVGRERFRQILRKFTKEHAFQLVTWEDFLQAIERGSAMELKSFYAQWFETAGAPNWELSWKQEGSLIKGVITQSAPTYTVRLDLEVQGNRRQPERHTVDVFGPRTEFTLPAQFRVRSVTLDPHYLVLRWTPEYRAEAMALAGYTRGSLRIRDGQLIEAEKEFQDALKQAALPDLYGARFMLENGLARVRISQKKWREAKSHLEIALANPTRRADVLPTTYLRLATVAKELGDDVLLRRAVKSAIATDAAVGNSTGVADAARALLNSNTPK
jgi:hypothetical protein